MNCLNFAIYYESSEARGFAENVKKGFFMDIFLLIIVGGSFVGLLGMISVLAVSTGFIFQGAMVGFIGALFLGMFLFLLATE